eukprot:TRINITY_DN92360_c0_g1_i1.p1 TRINITY_DN92360_c0_g1~~TRINITY_DN92360_c0_g1_i1.p1  ORF type:complete len:378 (+),score=53.90 TRINITY_DN92360_c0_g1_i1:60-1193(+)
MATARNWMLAGSLGLAWCDIQPEKGPHVQSGAGYSDGKIVFDDYQFDGFNGAISSICFKAVGNDDWIEQTYAVAEISVCYAGNCQKRGDWDGGDGKSFPLIDQGCFGLQTGEYITAVNTYMWFADDKTHGCDGHYDDTVCFKSSIQLVTSNGRGSRWYGFPREPPTSSPNYQSMVAPPGKHLVALYGALSWQVDQDPPAPKVLDDIGVYWGAGGGVGQWVAVQSCLGCSSTQFEIQTCTTRSAKDEKSLSNDWGWSTTGELSAGFNLEAVSSSAKASVSANGADKVVATSSNSFQVQHCETEKFTCDKAYLWQWVFWTNFDRKGRSVSTTSHKVCTDSPNPCCLPLTFSNAADPNTCDLNPTAANTCGKGPGATIVV